MEKLKASLGTIIWVGLLLWAALKSLPRCVTVVTQVKHRSEPREATMPSQNEPEKPAEKRRFPATPIYDQLVEELGAPWPSQTQKGRHSGDTPSNTD
jgi:hypothetical protein